MAISCHVRPPLSYLTLYLLSQSKLPDILYNSARWHLGTGRGSNFFRSDLLPLNTLYPGYMGHDSIGMRWRSAGYVAEEHIPRHNFTSRGCEGHRAKERLQKGAVKAFSPFTNVKSHLHQMYWQPAFINTTHAS